MSSSLSMRDLQNVSAQQWLDRASRIVPRILTVLLVIAIAWQLVQMTWLLLEREPEPSQIAAPPAALANAPRKTVNVQGIVDAHLFGVQQQVAGDASAAPQTQMNLVLAGTWASEDPAKGFAFIGESANTARMYAVGKAVRPGTVLHSVYPDQVVLDTSGKLESLRLPRLGGGNLAAQIARPPPRSAPTPVENLRRMAESNPAAFSEIVRPQPVFAGGVQRGYRVYPGRNRQQFAKLGLQPGDLVLSINGTPLDDPQRGMEIFNTMGAADRVTVTVERNGQPQELTLNMAQLSMPETPPPNGARRPPNSGPSSPE
jgi:general secretion pathway protein C